MLDETARIAIIGGGISGLSVAYEILKATSLPTYRGPKVCVSVFEKGLLGGNAHTAAFNLGVFKNRDVKDSQYIRWADLGVNDINLSTYDNVKRVMEEIGYIDRGKDGITGKLKPLENTTCYYSLDGHSTYTDDNDLAFGVSNPARCLQNVENGDLERVRGAINKAALQKIYGTPEPKKDDKIHDLETTVSQFFEWILSDVEAALKEHMCGDTYHYAVWQPEIYERIRYLVRMARDKVFYPRISAMYFTNDRGPEEMLLAAPFQYYLAQESVDGTSDRRYFTHGTRSWIEALERYLETQYNDDAFQIVRCSGGAKVSVAPNCFEVIHENENRVSTSNAYDYCVMATHADDALRALSFDRGTGDVQQKMELDSLEIESRNILEKVSYTQSIAVCHTYAKLLPPERDSWRAYNVLIRDGKSLKPYSMTYVCTRHQNDAELNSEYNYANLPQFFVTLNPHLPIPDDYVLDQIKYEDIPDQMKSELPQHTLGLSKSASKDFKGKPSGKHKAVAYFRHNLLDSNCFKAQQRLKDYHANFETRLFFTGGWSNKSGLHEDCWEQACTLQSLLFKKWL